QPGPAHGGILQCHQPADRALGLHCLPRGRRQRRAVTVSGLAGAPAGVLSIAAPQEPHKLRRGRLCTQVNCWLGDFWSPEQVAKRLRLEFPDDPSMWVSHETIYQSLFVQGRGELRRELVRALRSGQVRRRPRGRLRPNGQLPDMVTISERPAEAADRAVPGHWEGDLICGSHNRPPVGTLVEPSTRYVMLLHLPDGHEAIQVEKAMKQAIGAMPTELFKTLTWDRGKEMARHKEIKVATGVQVYFCDPHAPWQRGSNENTNRLLRPLELTQLDSGHGQAAAPGRGCCPRALGGAANPQRGRQHCTSAEPAP